MNQLKPRRQQHRLVESAIIFYAKASHPLKTPLFFTKRLCTR